MDILNNIIRDLVASHSIASMARLFKFSWHNS